MDCAEATQRAKKRLYVPSHAYLNGNHTGQRIAHIAVDLTFSMISSR